MSIQFSKEKFKKGESFITNCFFCGFHNQDYYAIEEKEGGELVVKLDNVFLIKTDDLSEKTKDKILRLAGVKVPRERRLQAVSKIVK